MGVRLAVCALFCLLAACGGSDSSPPTTASSPSSSPPPGQPPAPPPSGGAAGPWPVADITTYNATQSLMGSIIDASPDDAQNIWAVTPDSLYVLPPGQTTFRRYTAVSYT